jgi:hypothetical protein
MYIEDEEHEWHEAIPKHPVPNLVRLPDQIVKGYNISEINILQSLHWRLARRS